MSLELSFQMDGKSIPFREGDTIMDAALRTGAYIPHLCHNPEFEPHGSCRVCLVEVNGRRVSACTQPATAGMQVDSASDEINNARRSLLQMKFWIFVASRTRLKFLASEFNPLVLVFAVLPQWGYLVILKFA